MKTKFIRFATYAVIAGIAWFVLHPRTKSIPVSLTRTDFPEVFSTDMRNPKLPRLDQVDSFPALYRDATLKVAAAVRQEGLDPSEYLTEVRVEEAGHILRFELWHESIVGTHYEPGTKGDPSHKCRTVLYDSVKGAVTSISGWK